MMPPTIGRLVLFRIGGTDEHPILRPALVLNVWDASGKANLRVDLDPSNDAETVEALVARRHGHNMLMVSHHTLVWEEEARGAAKEYRSANCLHLPSVLYAYSAEPGDGVGEWRWPVRV